MKTERIPGARWRGRFVVAWWLAIGGAARLVGAEDSASAYTLFMGADFAVEWKGGLRPVETVRGSSFVVTVDRQAQVVPTVRTDLKVKVEDQLKLARQSAFIANFRAERAYTPANDPKIKAEKMISNAMAASAAADLAGAQMRRAVWAADQAGAQAGQMAGDPALAGQYAASAAAANSAAAASTSNYAQALVSEGSSSLNDVASQMQRLDDELGEQNFDAFELSFDLSAPEAHRAPYLVVVTRFRAKSDRPDGERTWVYAEALPQIDATPHRIRLLRGGFPPGYELKDCRVHLYAEGSEIATNLSRKRVALNAEEAFQFAVFDYAGQRAGATEAPTPAPAFWPADLRQRLAGEPAERVVFVRVGKDGKAIGVFGDKDCAVAVSDGNLASVLPDLRFYPAIAKGKAVEGVLALKLGGPVR